MAKIRILRGTVCGGKCVEAGDVVEASKEDAELLIGLEKAEPADGRRAESGKGSMKAKGSALVDGEK